jgi:hypothetical protein
MGNNNYWGELMHPWASAFLVNTVKRGYRQLYSRMWVRWYDDFPSRSVQDGLHFSFGRARFEREPRIRQVGTEEKRKDGE